MNSRGSGIESDEIRTVKAMKDPASLGVRDIEKWGVKTHKGGCSKR